MVIVDTLLHTRLQKCTFINKGTFNLVTTYLHHNHVHSDNYAHELW